MNESNKSAENTQTSLETAKNEPRESMVWYRSFFDAIERLKDEQRKYQCYLMVFEYGLNRKAPETDDDVICSLFTMVKPLIDKSLARYDNCKKNGKKGGNPNFAKGKKNPYYNGKDNQGHNQEDNQGDNLNYNENYNDNVNYNYNENYNENDNVNLVDNETLSQISTKFSLKFPSKNLHIKQVSEINKVNLQRIDVDKLIKKINDSDFLLNNKNLGLEWCILNYERICAGEFDNYVNTNKNQTSDSFSNSLSRAEQALNELYNEGVIDIEN